MLLVFVYHASLTSKSGSLRLVRTTDQLLKSPVVVVFLRPGKFIIWAAATMLIQAERQDSSVGPMTLPLAEKMTLKVLKEKVDDRDYIRRPSASLVCFIHTLDRTDHVRLT